MFGMFGISGAFAYALAYVIVHAVGGPLVTVACGCDGCEGYGDAVAHARGAPSRMRREARVSRTPIGPIDVRDVVPEAREIVAAATAVYLRHTAPWFVGLLAHGSAVKGGFIPGCSDIDLHLYLDPAALAAEGRLPLALARAIHHDLASIDPAPFAYLQCYTSGGNWVPAGKVGPTPGAYTMIAGRLPIPPASAAELVASSERVLARVATVRAGLADALLDVGGGKLERAVRFLCTDVWPTLPALLTLRGVDPLRAWALPKPEAIALLPPQTTASEAIRTFEAAVRAYYPAQTSLDAALAVIAAGDAFLAAAGVAWRDGPTPPSGVVSDRV